MKIALIGINSVGKLMHQSNAYSLHIAFLFCVNDDLCGEPRFCSCVQMPTTQRCRLVTRSLAWRWTELGSTG